MHKSKSNETNALGKSTKQYIEDAIRHYKEQRYQEAIEAFEHAIQINPASVRALHGRGVILTRMKEYEKAIESYEQACKLAPDVAKIHLDVAEVFYILGDYAKSRSAYKQAIQLDSTHERVYHSKTQELVDKAFALLREGKREEAITAFQQVILFNSADTQAPHYLSVLQRQQTPITYSSYSSSSFGTPQFSHRELEREAMYNNQWNLRPSIHPANCRCPECWEP